MGVSSGVLYDRRGVPDILVKRQQHSPASCPAWTGRPSIPEKLAIDREAAAYWMPAFRGYDSGVRSPLQPRKPRLHRIIAAVEFAQIGQPAHRQTMRILLAGLEQHGDVVRHLGARLCAGGGGAVHQEIVGVHDAVDRGFHGILVCVQTSSVASNCAIALLASLILLSSPR